MQIAFEILHLGKIKNGFDRIYSFLKYRKYIQCIFVLFYIELLTFLQCCIKSVQMFLHTITPIYTTNSFLFRCLFYARDFCKYLQILANLVESNPFGIRIRKINTLKVCINKYNIRKNSFYYFLLFVVAFFQLTSIRADKAWRF